MTKYYYFENGTPKTAVNTSHAKHLEMQGVKMYDKQEIVAIVEKEAKKMAPPSQPKARPEAKTEVKTEAKHSK